MVPPATLRPGQVLGDFVLEAKLALGGMAEIWTAQGDDGPVALKVLLPHFVDNPAFLAMFEDEVRIARRLQHRNIISVRGAHEEQGQVFQSMELLEGFDLRRVLSHAARAQQRLPVPLCLFVAREVARALSYAHTRRGEDGRALDIVHRDVSPHNVMLCGDGQVKLLDFGIARAAERAARTRTGVIKGKLAYMAPEQALAVGVTPQTDIFASGVVLWEMLTVERLFVADSDAELVERVVAAMVPPVQAKNPEVPDDVAALLARMLAQRAPDRPASMQEVERSLTRALALHFAADQADEAALARWMQRHGPGATPQTQALDEPSADGTQDPATQPDAVPAGQGDAPADITATMAHPLLHDDATWAGALPSVDATAALKAPQAPEPARARPAPAAMPAEDVARTLVDQPMDPSLMGPLPAFLTDGAPERSPRSAAAQTPTPSTTDDHTPSAADTPAPSAADTPPAAPAKIRAPTRAEIMRAVENQATVEVQADPELAKLAQHIVRVKDLPTVEPVEAAEAPGPQDTLLVAPAAPVQPVDQAPPRAEQPTQLGDLVPPHAPEAQPVVVKGTDNSGGYEPLGLRAPPQPPHAQTPSPAPVRTVAPAPAPSRLGNALPVITMVLAGIVLVLIFLLLRGQ